MAPSDVELRIGQLASYNNKIVIAGSNQKKMKDLTLL